MEWKIAIPSYKRAEILKRNTLETLKSLSVPIEKIIIFVVEGEYDEYRRIHPEYKIVVGEEGLTNQRKFIENYFLQGEHIIFMDDDIKGILSNYTDINIFFNEAFNRCDKENVFIWGVYPVNNKFFMDTCKEITTDLKYIVGCMYGIINRPNDVDLALTLTCETGNKEDVERTLLYYMKDGKVLRFNRVVVVTKYYGTDGGGLGKFKDRLDSMRNATIAINAKYPLLTGIKIKKSGMHEVVFKKLRKGCVGCPPI